MILGSVVQPRRAFHLELQSVEQAFGKMCGSNPARSVCRSSSVVSRPSSDLTSCDVGSNPASYISRGSSDGRRLQPSSRSYRFQIERSFVQAQPSAFALVESPDLDCGWSRLYKSEVRFLPRAWIGSIMWRQGKQDKLLGFSPNPTKDLEGAWSW